MPPFLVTWISLKGIIIVLSSSCTCFHNFSFILFLCPVQVYPGKVLKTKTVYASSVLLQYWYNLIVWWGCQMYLWVLYSHPCQLPHGRYALISITSNSLHTFFDASVRYQIIFKLLYSFKNNFRCFLWFFRNIFTFLILRLIESRFLWTFRFIKSINK